MQFQLGKRKPKIDARTLRFRKYVAAKAPKLPARADWSKKVPEWPMMLNNIIGDCTCAAAGHMIQCWTANRNPPMRIVRDAEIKRVYQHFTGDGPGWKHAAVRLLDLLKFWRSKGIGGHKIHSFAALDLRDRRQVMRAVDLFGGCYIGVTLPDFAVNDRMLKTRWHVPVGKRPPPPNPKYGHCIPAVAYNRSGLTVVTWGETKAMSWAFYEAYADEAFALLSKSDWISKKYKKKAPPGFDLTRLEADLKSVTAGAQKKRV